jgi:O-antigen ligase
MTAIDVATGERLSNRIIPTAFNEARAFPTKEAACMTPFDRAEPRAVAAPVEAEPRGLAVSFGRVLLLLVVPFSFVWIQIGHVPGLGNLTLSDAALAALWGLAAWHLWTRGPALLDLTAAGLVVFSVLLGLLAAIGSELSGIHGAGRFEFFLTMKRFGLASVLPLSATLFRSARLGPWIRAVSLISLLALAISILYPDLQAFLPRPEDWNEERSGNRATGLLTNPNDLSYAAVGLFILHSAFTKRGQGVVGRAAFILALLAFAVCVIGSASRSGLVGAAGALVYIMFSPIIGFGRKLLLLVILICFVAGGLSWSSAFDERISRAYTQGRSDSSVSSRLEAQWLALQASVRHPFGVGFTGYANSGTEGGVLLSFQGTDNVFVEALLGSGFLGLLSLLLLYRAAWVFVSRRAAPGSVSGPVLRSGLVAFFLFGFASIIPFAVTLSPLFFLLVAAAAVARPPYSFSWPETPDAP